MEITGSMGLYVWIAIESALGGVPLLVLGRRRTVDRRDFPVGDPHRQCRGSFIIGSLPCHPHRPDGKVFVGTTAQQFVMVGFCGGYTTFSSFSL